MKLQPAAIDISFYPCVCVCVLKKERARVGGGERERERESDSVHVPDYKFNVRLSDLPQASIYNLSGRRRGLSKCH